MIFIENKKKKKKTLDKLYSNAVLVDVTSKGKEPFLKLSPFYPHGNIPVPFTKNIYSYSVEGIWQGLKVFEHQDIDPKKFMIKNMKNIKRSRKKFGTPIGHRKGVYGNELLNYVIARKQIYIPTYKWVLKNRTYIEIEHLTLIALKQDLVLLDFETNLDVKNITKPFSHAAIIKMVIEKKHPELINKRFSKSITMNKEKKIKNSNHLKEEQLKVKFE